MLSEVVSSIYCQMFTAPFPQHVVKKMFEDAFEHFSDQEYYPELQAKYKETSFVIDLGDFPEYNIKGLIIVKAKNSNSVSFYEDTDMIEKPFTLNGFAEFLKSKKSITKEEASALELLAKAKSNAAAVVQLPFLASPTALDQFADYTLREHKNICQYIYTYISN